MLPLPNERFRTAIVCTIHTGACVCVCVSFPYHAECDWHCKMVLRAAYLYNTDYCCCAKNNNAKINTWQSSESRVLFGAFAYFVDRIEWTDFMYMCTWACFNVLFTILTQCSLRCYLSASTRWLALISEFFSFIIYH